MKPRLVVEKFSDLYEQIIIDDIDTISECVNNKRNELLSNLRLMFHKDEFYTIDNYEFKYVGTIDDVIKKYDSNDTNFTIYSKIIIISKKSGSRVLYLEKHLKRSEILKCCKKCKKSMTKNEMLNIMKNNS